MPETFHETFVEDALAVHRGADAVRAFYAQLCATGGVPLEQCALIDDGRVGALEHNVVQWGDREQLPQAGLTVYVRGDTGKLVASRRYGDADRPERRG
jgi:hypothetical protein